MHDLTKSKLISFLQCPRRLYLEIKKPELRATSAGSTAIMAAGNDVGDIARSMHPEGIYIETLKSVDAIQQTAQHMAAKNRKPLFEAAFLHDGTLVRSDLLLPGKKVWHLVEVKSSTSVKDYHLQDAAIQRFVLEKSGVAVGDVAIQVIDTSFLYPGKNCYDQVKKNGTVNSLFKQQDVTNDITPLVRKDVPEWIRAARKTLAGKLPAATDHCDEPFECPFKGYCHADAPEFPIECLPRISGAKVADLRAQGYADIRDIPAGVLTNELHERVRKLTVQGKPELRPEAAVQLASLSWPRYYLDFETINFAVPIWKGTHPYQQVPFQWSCHIARKDGTMAHREFLDLSGDDPSRKFAEALLDATGKRGPILVYNQGFEGRIVKELALRYKDLAEPLMALTERFVDLLPITREHYYHPDMRGSWSIKSVLPTIAAELDYANLGEVQNGGLAQQAFVEAISADTPTERKQKIERDLLAYCERDTEAMIRLMSFLLGNKTTHRAKSNRTSRKSAQ